MLKRALLVTAIIPFAGLNLFTSGCEHDTIVDPPDENAVILAINPEPGEDNFFFEAPLWADFDKVPDSVEMTLEPGGGAMSSDGTTFTFTPASALDSRTDYTWTITWSVGELSDTLAVAFTTGPYGEAVGDAMDLQDVTFNLDLASANFTEPPGIGGIIASQLEGFSILFMVTADSNWDANELQTLGALGDEEGGSLDQDACASTLNWTAGEDGIPNNSDDVPAAWDDPRFIVGPTELNLSISGVTANLYDVFLTGVVHPDVVDMRGVTFEGTLDTRALDGLLDEEGGEGAACDFVGETLGITCEACPDGSGDFCLSAAADSIVAAEVPGVVIEPLTCMDVLDRWVAGTCSDEDAADYDSTGDGVHDQCPDWVAP